MTEPQIVAVLPVEDVLESLAQPDRRVSLHRVFFDLYATAFPAAFRLTVALVVCGGTGQQRGEVQLLAADGVVVCSTPFVFTARTFHVQVAVLNGLMPAAGDYRIVVQLGDQPHTNVPLVVVDLAEEAAP